MHQSLKSSLAEILGNRCGRYHHSARFVMKAAKQRIGDRFRYPGAGADVLREPRMIARGEKPFFAQAIAAPGKAQRALGRYVDIVGRGSIQSSRDRLLTCQREPDLGIGRQWDRGKTLRG